MNNNGMSQPPQQLSESSLIRNFGIGTKLTDIEIMQIQNAYGNKDTSRLKQIFGKPRNFKNRTILAYASNVVQYIDRLDNPTQQIQQFAQQKYNITLSNDLEQNLILMGNRRIIAQPSRSQLPQRTPVQQIVQPPNSTYRENNRYAQWEITIPNNSDLQNGLRQTNFTNAQIRVLRSYGIEKMRLFMIVVFRNGQKQFVSTELLDLDQFVDIDIFIQAYNINQIVNQDRTRVYTYDKFDFNTGVIQQNVIVGIESMFIKFYKRGY